MLGANIVTCKQPIDYSKTLENAASSKLFKVIKSIKDYVQNIKLSRPFRYVLSKFKALTEFLRTRIENIIPLQRRINQIVDAHQNHDIKKCQALLNLLKLRFKNKTPEQLKKLSVEIDLAIINKNKKTPDRCSPSIIVIAFDCNDTDMINQLVKSGSDVNKTVKYGRTLLFLAFQSNDTNMIKELKKAGADINHTDKNGKTALLLSAEGYDSKIAARLLRFGADVNKTDKLGQTALSKACQHNNVKMVRLLLKYNANINIMDNYDRKAYFIAYQNKNVEIVDLLSAAEEKRFRQHFS